MASFSAHSLSMLDVRGAYALRLRMLLLQAGVMAFGVALGAAAGHSVSSAILGAAFMAMVAGFLRHFVGEYGAGVGTPAALLFFTALASPHPIALGPGSWLVAASLGGSVWGIALHILGWPIAPQQPLRAALAESWEALANFCDALAARPLATQAAEHGSMASQELALDQILARTQLALDGAGHPSQRAFLPSLLLLNRRAGGLATQLASLDQLLGSRGPDLMLEESLHTLQTSLSNTAKAIALTVVSRRADHVDQAVVRLERALHLAEVLEARMGSRMEDPLLRDHALDLIRTLGGFLVDLQPLVRRASGRDLPSEAPSFELVDLHNPPPSPLARAFNLDYGMGRDLFRFSLRLAVAMALGTAIFKCFHLPHGFWIPFSTLVVLQPDFEATRSRALQRGMGTLLGGLAVSLLLWIHLPHWALLALTALLCAIFTHYVKRHYGTGIFLLTVLVILQLEVTTPVTLGLTLERLGCCVLGSVLAVLAAWRLWPVWEEQRIRPLLATALHLSGDYMKALLEAIHREDRFPSRELLRDKLQTEVAHGRTFGCLARMAKEPAERRTSLAASAALANGNLRLVHILNSMLARLGQQDLPHQSLDLSGLAACAETVLSNMAHSLDGSAAPTGDCQRLCPFRLRTLETTEADAWVAARLGHAAVEMEGMAFGVRTLLGGDRETDPTTTASTVPSA